MDNGFITLHRKITDNPIWQNAELGHLFVHLLLMANHERKRILRKGQEEWIERGQLKTGQYLLAMQTGIPRGSIYYHLKTLENLGIVSIKASSKYSIITLIKYEDYQSNKGKFSSKVSSKLVTDKLHVSTNNNVNNENNETIKTIPPVADDVNQLFKIFYDTINPNINYAHKGNRNDAKFLVDKYGIENTLKFAEYAIKVQGKPYAPTITTPSQLKNKLSELRIYGEKQKNINQPKKGLEL